MRTLVTGATGFIGAHALAHLVERGHEVVGLSRRRSGAPAHVDVDLEDRRRLREAVSDIRPEAVVHLAAHVPTDDQAEIDRSIAANVIGTANLLDACAALKRPPTVVYSSTMSVYDERPAELPVRASDPVRPRGAYGHSKYAAELLCRRYADAGANVMILRFPGVYGPGRGGGLIGRALVSARDGSVVEIASPRTKRDFLYVKDAAASIALAIDAARPEVSTCNVSGGSPLVLSDLADLVREMTGRTLTARLGDRTEPDFYFDPEDARRALGFTPRGIRAALEDYWRSLPTPA